MKRILLIFILALSVASISSCRIRGLTNDYQFLTEEQKKRIVPLTDFKERNEDLIFKINGSQLNTELKDHERSLVYVFKNGCTSTYCKPLSTYVDYAAKHHLKLFLVMDGYINLTETTDQYPKAQLYAIDNAHYKEEKRAKYTVYFTNDLLQKPLNEPQKKHLGNLYFFSQNKLDSIVRELSH